MYKKTLFLLCLSVFLPLVSSGQNKRLALIIGNANYVNTQALANPVNDANSIYFMLDKLGFDLMKFENVNQTEMKRAIDEFGEKLKKYDVGLFYYAGHGVQVNGTNYLLPVDVNLKSEKDAEYDCIDAGRVLSKFEDSGVKTSIIILDACRNNPFAKSWSRSIKSNGLAFMEAPAGALIAYATQPGSVAFDGKGSNGLYTECLLKCIGDPELNLMQVFQKVTKMVREGSSGVQIPWEYTSFEGDFYFNQTGVKLNYTDTSPLPQTETAGGKQIMPRIKSIKTNPSVIWAEARSGSSYDADVVSRQNLDKILVDTLLNMSQKKITGNSAYKTDDIVRKGCELYVEELQPFISRIVYTKGSKSTVLRSILKSDIEILLNLKKEYILSLFDQGTIAERNFETGDALRYYFWAYTLTVSNPEGRQIKIPSQNGPSSQNTQDFLADKIDNIMKSITCKIVDTFMYEGYKRAELKFYFKNQVIRNIDFRYWNGAAWSEENCVNNDIGFVDLYPDYKIKDFRVEIAYDGINKSKFDNTLHRTVQLAQAEQFRQQCRVDRDFSKPKKTEPLTTDNKIYIDAVKDAISGVGKKENNFNEKLFTRNGFEIYKALILYGNASFLSNESNFTVSRFGNFTYVRGIPVKFRFRNNSVEFFEKLCFQLDSAARINNITFYLGDKASADIIGQTRWPEECKFQIINFLENYKTAYALKRYDYIDKIFSDNALIIVGQKVEESEDIDASKTITFGDNYKLIKLTKEQYMYRLKKVFDKNEFINIQFEENVVKRRDNESDVYGINIKQNYFSANYADKGHLFLMVDLKEKERPIIYVRAWQPEDFENKHIISLSDFSF